MWWLLLLVLCGVVSAFDRDAARDKVTEYRVSSQNLHIDKLEKDLAQLEDKFSHLSPDVTDADIRYLRARVRKNVVRGKCGKNQASCGGDWPECVNSLLFCDGVNDCRNGGDEGAAICNDDIVKEGSAFSGVVHWQSCAQLKDHPTFITITAMHRAPYFKSRAFVRAQIANDVSNIFTDHKQGSYTARGYYAFSHRKLMLVPDENAPHRYGIVCTFDHGDNDHATCEIMTEGAKQRCARARVSREYAELQHHLEWH